MNSRPSPDRAAGARRADVAVVIPVYNGRKYLRETIESVLGQKLPPAEIVVIDDGSTDGSAEVAREFEPHLRLVVRANSGVSATRNFGASVTQAAWLAFLDQDDLWDPDNLARQTAEIARHPDADVCYAGRRLLYREAGSEAFTLMPMPPMPQPGSIHSLLLERCPFSPCSALIRRETFTAVGGFDGRHNGAEDWDLWLRLSFHGAKFVSCPHPLVQYRAHPESVSQNALKMLPVQIGVVRHNVLPRMTTLERATKGRMLESQLVAEAAILLRSHDAPGSLRVMLHSILMHPFHSSRRYKVVAHMVLTAARRRLRV